MAAGLEAEGTKAEPPWRRMAGRRAAAGKARWSRIVGSSPAALRLERMIDRAAAFDSTVLVSGETGCGKEEIARAIHARGPRSQRPFVAVNCGAMAPSLIESQLFGHEKGSYTGALGSTQGVFRAAAGGVVFLDEIGEMPLDLQPRLLRVLQEREVTPIGSTDVHPIDVQVVAATNRELDAAIDAGTFREDLYFRLNTIEITVPPLRERADDIPLFLDHFCRHFGERFGVEPWRPDPVTIERLVRYTWPGNVRQLAQTVERYYALGELPALPPAVKPASAVPVATPAAPAAEPDDEPALPVLDLDALRLIAVRQAMKRTNNHKGQAAALLGVHINTMTKLVAEALPADGRRRPKAK